MIKKCKTIDKKVLEVFEIVLLANINNFFPNNLLKEIKIRTKNGQSKNSKQTASTKQSNQTQSVK